MRRIVVPLLACAVWTAAWAQREPDSLAHDGRWNARIQAESGRPQAARLELSNFEGTWRDVASGNSSRAKACRGRKLPVTVQVSTANELEFTVWGTSAAPTCPDLTVTLRVAGAKVLEGTTGTGEGIRLTRR